MDLKSAWRPESVAGPRARVAVAKRVYGDSSRQRRTGGLPTNRPPWVNWPCGSARCAEVQASLRKRCAMKSTKCSGIVPQYFDGYESPN
jgi:hypothetical protein